MTTLTYMLGLMDYTPGQIISLILFFPMLGSSLVAAVAQGAVNFFSSR